MTGLQEMVFISEIVLQSKIARRAAERLQAIHNNSDKVEVWCSIQSILVASGNISKILWPSKKEYKERGERLRHLLKVEKMSPLYSRKFRNYFEHYDEQIDDYLSNSSGGVYIDLSMNPSLRGSFTTNHHRGYNSFNNTLLFHGELLDLNEILRALEEIF